MRIKEPPKNSSFARGGVQIFDLATTPVQGFPKNASVFSTKRDWVKATATRQNLFNNFSLFFLLFSPVLKNVAAYGVNFAA